ncbi:hypothetical protein SD71_10960 [Cohnella kolymensis]|uniref:DUF5643 domain-containing protein n=1 Tax=Cohnella kolymensis TaxID=1590652 RepID=A0ABR5A4C1_9BACL|nr:hypothetical protein [Cohnella kolymensis]KIL35897.1 hypothetical protein SD71_10960 [Cohnella kolymensis]
MQLRKHFGSIIIIIVLFLLILAYVYGTRAYGVGMNTNASVNHGPAPIYVNPNISLNKSVINQTDSLAITLNFTAEQDITLDVTRLAFYPLGKQEPAFYIPIPEWSHTALKRGTVRDKKLSISPIEKGLDAGYYQVVLEFQIGGTQLSTPADLLINHPPGTLRVGKLEINQIAKKEGYTLTVNSLTMSEDKVVVDVQFSPQVLEFYSEFRLEDGRKLREFGRDATRKPQPEHLQFTFSPIPKSSSLVTFEIESINIQKPDGIYGVPGHWAVTISLP